MRKNVKGPRPKTHEGAVAVRLDPERTLRRSIMACLLWEGEFYEDGESIADRIMGLIPKVKPERVAAMAVECREKMKLRHMPLLLCRELARQGTLKAETLGTIIQRADELAEFVALYWKDGRCPLSAQVKKGLARAFKKFDAYNLAKYNRDGLVSLRDVMFMVHPKPNDEEQAATWKKLAEGTLEPPDTWEVALSKTDGVDKKAKWERLLKEKKLGGFALIRNLCNMIKAKVPEKLITEALGAMKADRILPFRFYAAAKMAPRFELALDDVMLRCLGQMPKLAGKTVLVVDVSGSMYGQTISGRSKMDRAQVACVLAAFAREVCETARIYATAGNDGAEVHDTQEVPARRGMALADAIHGMCRPLGGGGIFLTQVMDYIEKHESNVDRVIVITDEQDCDHNPKRSPSKAKRIGRNNYLINVGSYENGIGYEPWHHIDGWSESVIDYIRVFEESDVVTN